MKQPNKKKILDKAKEIFEDLLGLLSFDVVFSFQIQQEKVNEDNGCFGICYEPTTKKADLYVYQDIYKEIPDLNKRQLSWLEYTLAHEVGHIVCWELSDVVKEKYIKDISENTATEIGMLLVKLYKK